MRGAYPTLSIRERDRRWKNADRLLLPRCFTADQRTADSHAVESYPACLSGGHPAGGWLQTEQDRDLPGNVPAGLATVLPVCRYSPGNRFHRPADRGRHRAGCGLLPHSALQLQD